MGRFLTSGNIFFELFQINLTGSIMKEKTMQT